MPDAGAGGRGDGEASRDRRPPPRHRPPWWPEAEPWPPRDASGRPTWPARGPWRRPLARRLGCLFGLLGLLAIVGLGAVAWALLDALGGTGLPAGRSPHPLLFLGIGLAVVAVALIARGFRRVAEPLDLLVAAARRVERGDYAARVPEPRGGDPEIRELVHAFNTMAARLETDEGRRRRLLADVSHELRTPLAVIRGDLEAMVDGIHPVDEEHLALVVDETAVLERLVEDLRTLSLADAGALALHREPTDVEVLVGEIVAGLRPTAERAGVRLEAALPDDLPLVDLDPVRIREVLANLISNALRHTRGGGSVTVGGSADGKGVRLTVHDTGEGIAPELLPHVFDRFTRGPSSRGSGLGLAIARDLVAAHGGTISVESAPGAGSTFTVALPVAPGRG